MRPVTDLSRRFRCALSAAFVPVLLTAALPLPAGAGRIRPDLQADLARRTARDTVTVVFALERQVDLPVLDAALKTGRVSRADRHRRVVEALRAEAAAGQASFLEEVQALRRAGEVSRYTPYWIRDLVVVRGTPAAVERLAARTDVDLVEPVVRPVPADGAEVEGPGGPRGVGVAVGVRAINAPRVWYELGITGAGTLVGSLDTGVDGNHPALRQRWRGNQGHPWQECWHDVLGTGTQFPFDGNGHGTHVTGTLTGLGAATEDTIGVAWGAEWIAANAINQSTGHELDFDVMDCLQWFADPDGNPGTVDDVPDVVINAWGINELLGGSPPYTDCDSRWWWAIDACEAAGVALIWSAGGDGPGPGTIRSPADRAATAGNCFSVGAVDAAHSGFPYPITSFSSRGPTGCDVPEGLRIKPEVTAPGVDIYSSIPSGGYALYSGSAMAGPHAAGIVALLREVDPDLDVDTIKGILMATARDEGPAGEDNAYGWGVIDAYAAVNSLFPPGDVSSGGPADRLGLSANRPNPFTRETLVQVRLLSPGPATLSVYDAGGRLVRTLLEGTLSPGLYTARWNGCDQAGRPLPSGVYACGLRTARGSAERLMILVR